MPVSLTTLTFRRLLAAASVGALSVVMPAVAHGATASEVVSAGSLSFINSTPADVTFPATTLNGTDQLKTQSQQFDVNDSSGSNAGWAVTATSTTFTAGVHQLLPTATTVPSPPTDVCDVSSTCVLATNSVTYPWNMPAGNTAPAASKLFNAAAGTGSGSQTVTPTWQLSVPSTTWAGGAATPYTSTWTFTLVSGP